MTSKFLDRQNGHFDEQPVVILKDVFKELEWNKFKQELVWNKFELIVGLIQMPRPFNQLHLFLPFCEIAVFYQLRSVLPIVL